MKYTHRKIKDLGFSSEPTENPWSLFRMEKFGITVSIIIKSNGYISFSADYGKGNGSACYLSKFIDRDVVCDLEKAYKSFLEDSATSSN